MEKVHHVPCHENSAENTDYSKDLAEGHIKQSYYYVRFQSKIICAQLLIKG
jgi:hypothetical protein